MCTVYVGSQHLYRAVAITLGDHDCSIWYAMLSRGSCGLLVGNTLRLVSHHELLQLGNGSARIQTLEVREILVECKVTQSELVAIYMMKQSMFTNVVVSTLTVLMQ